MEQRTIAAISTPVGAGGIAVIRISGADAIRIADSVFCGRTALLEADSHTVQYGHIVDKNENIIDEVLVSLMRAPRTYTREDVVEISTHGGVVASKNVMKCLMEAGAYPAQAGEFTKRAFLNGRIDLSQAEAVIDIINSKTTLEQKNALSQAGGSLSTEINKIRQNLVNLAASMQVIIDYPDEELEDVTIDDIADVVSASKMSIEKLLNTSDNGKIIKDGIKTVIAGKPNAGKSSLLNVLAKEDRAIVTDIAGTTRDVIEESVNIDGIALRLIDTAGIRETDDIIEKMGVERSLKSIDEADLIIVVLDLTSKITDDEKELLDNTKDRKRIIVLNKSDAEDLENAKEIKDFVGSEFIEISAKTGDGIGDLIDCIKKMYDIDGIVQNEGCFVTNLRHVSALSKASQALCNAKKSIEEGMPADIASIDINAAIEALGEITGAVVSDDIVSAIFHDFCVGK